ncbi:hypothetical protein FRX31_005032 [Thalictrum thalictroides]|uniref:Uncharacterized protein n=1 Tax=Thalictrum thalictroides TaxID=46969 RepID=A0A7J6X6X8_THATH|nr:hypothetical protein FRX31_005032 [Thalictrum thalictroides]
MGEIAGEIKIHLEVEGEEGLYNLSIDRDRIDGREVGIEENIAIEDHINLFGISFHLGGKPGFRDLELKKVYLCSSNRVISINLGNCDSIVVRDEDRREGFRQIHQSAIDFFSDRNHIIIGFNLSKLKFHLTELGINLSANFVDLTEKGIKNWEKGVAKHLHKKKMVFSNCDSDLAKGSISAHFSRKLYIQLNH